MPILDHGARGVRRGGGYRALFGEGEGVARGEGVPSSLVRGREGRGYPVRGWGDDVTGEGDSKMASTEYVVEGG